MTKAEIAAMLNETGLKYAYMMFPIGKAPALPYLIYYYPDENGVNADNSNYLNVTTIRIELYTKNKDFTTEALVESKLLFPYSKSVEYIDSEKMYQITYESEVIING